MMNKSNVHLNYLVDWRLQIDYLSVARHMTLHLYEKLIGLNQADVFVHEVVPQVENAGTAFRLGCGMGVVLVVLSISFRSTVKNDCNVGVEYYSHISMFVYGTICTSK